MTSNNNKKTKRTKDHADTEEPVIKKQVVAYKYSAKGTSSLYEAITGTRRTTFYNMV